ncbi:MAG: alpha/beta fold hydrolase, partial [Cyanobacteria bacterium J06641_5]
FLLGYSLGGRLALHALATEPDLWAGAIVIAAHPGLQSTGERVQRRARDRIWARRFAREPLELVFSDWDSQAIFQQIPCPLPRSLAALSRARARAGFERFSLGLQTDLRPILQQLGRPPILYIAGKQDAKYLQLGRNLTAICPAMTLAVVPGAAHRVPWEQPTSFMESVRAFLAA